MKKKIGVETTICIRGVNWPVIIKSIEDGVIKLDIKSKVGNEVKFRPATLAFTQISPAERIRLTNAPDTEAKFVAMFALDFKAKDYQTALKIADKCGPFADIFKTRVAKEMARNSNE